MYTSHSLLLELSLKFVGDVWKSDEKVIEAAQKFVSLGSDDVFSRPQDHQEEYIAAADKFKEVYGEEAFKDIMNPSSPLYQKVCSPNFLALRDFTFTYSITKLYVANHI